VIPLQLVQRLEGHEREASLGRGRKVIQGGVSFSGNRPFMGKTFSIAFLVSA